MITQLNPPIPLETPKGKALAHFVIDYGPEHHLMWVTFVDATGECWTWPNPKIRAQSNITMGRKAEAAPMAETSPTPLPVAANGHTTNGKSNGSISH